MALNAKKVPNTAGPKAPPVDAGGYPGRLVQVIDLGLQPQRPFKGEEKKPAYEIMTTYELSDEFLKDEDGEDIVDKPRWLSETFPFHSLEADRAKSTARYLALDPDQVHDGDWIKLLGVPCTINVVQNKGSGKNAGNIYNNIASTIPMRAKEAAKLPELVNPTKYLSLDEEDVETFLSLPEFIQEKIKEGLEYEGTALARALKRYKGKDEKADADEANVPEKPKGKKPDREVVEDDDIPFDEPEEENGENW